MPMSPSIITAVNGGVSVKKRISNLGCLRDASPQLEDIVGNEVGQVSVLSVAPDLLRRVEFGRIGRKPLHPDAIAEAPLQPSHAGAMHLPSVEYQDDVAAQSTQQAGDKLHKVVGDDVVIDDVEVEAQAMTVRRAGEGRND